MIKKVTLALAFTAMSLSLSVNAQELSVSAEANSKLDGLHNASQDISSNEPVYIMPDININDTDSESLESVSVRILDFQDDGNEFLAVDDGALGESLATHYDAGELIIQGNASAEDYTKALRHLTYLNKAVDSTDNQERKIALLINDGEFTTKAIGSFGIYDASQMQDFLAEKAIEDDDARTEEQIADAKESGQLTAEYETLGLDAVAGGRQSLHEVMAKAYVFNKELMAEREQVKVVSEDVTETFSEWLPTITATAARGQEVVKRKGATINKVDDTVSSQSINLELPLFDGFRSYTRYRREKARLVAAQANLASIEQEVLLNSVISYLNVVREKETHHLSKEKENAIRRHYDGTRVRFELGEVTQTDVSQSYTRLTRSIADRVQDEGDYEGAKAVYERIVGEVPYGLHLDVKYPKVLENLDHDRLIEEGLLNNPLITLAHYNVKSAEFDIDNKQAARMPQLSLNASKSWAGRRCSRNRNF